MILSYVRTVVLYLVLIFVIRMMGKRQVGEMEPAEFVVTMLVANSAAIPMQDGGIPLYSGVVPILTVLGVELLLSGLQLKSRFVRKLLCGNPLILIDNGKILQKNLRRARITMDELSAHLREKDVADISAVQFAVLETDGDISVFPFPKEKPASAKDAGIEASRRYLPVTLVSDGCLLRENLERAGKNEAWVNRVLEGKGGSLRSTWLLTVDGGDKIVYYPKEE